MPINEALVAATQTPTTVSTGRDASAPLPGSTRFLAISIVGQVVVQVLNAGAAYVKAQGGPDIVIDSATVEFVIGLAISGALEFWRRRAADNVVSATHAG